MIVFLRKLITFFTFCSYEMHPNIEWPLCLLISTLFSFISLFVSLRLAKPSYYFITSDNECTVRVPDACLDSEMHYLTVTLRHHLCLFTEMPSNPFSVSTCRCVHLSMQLSIQLYPTDNTECGMFNKACSNPLPSCRTVVSVSLSTSLCILLVPCPLCCWALCCYITGLCSDLSSSPVQTAVHVKACPNVRCRNKQRMQGSDILSLSSCPAPSHQMA